MNKEQQSMIYSTYTNNYVYNLIPRNKKILDVGCNTGNLGERLIKEKNCEVWGVDYSTEVIKLAEKKLTKVRVFDLETYEIPFIEEKFDLIIFADILEHIKYPEIILEKFSLLLKNGGVVVASIPNVANINVRFSLFFGRWNYKENNILDKTHFKFFTKKTIKELFKDSGYQIISIKSTPGFNFIVFRYFKILKTIQKYLCKLYPKLFARQFIILSKKNDKN